MRWAVAVDENVWINAMLLKDELDEDDITSFELLVMIRRNGHLIAATGELYAAWHKQIETRKSTTLPLVAIFSRLYGSLMRSQLAIVESNPMTSDETDKIRAAHGEIDLQVAISAAGAPSSDGSAKGLVSTDRSLNRDLEAWGVDARHAFVCLTPRQALPKL